MLAGQWLFEKLTDPLLRQLADAKTPARATPARLMAACRTGNASLHGTGVHPTFMVERLVMRMTQAMSEVTHIRFVEAADFSLAPDGMWGGLELFGFGRDPADIDDEWLLAKAGDFYYGDLTGNVAHALYGAGSEQVRVRHTLRAIPAVADLRVGATTIKAGTAAAMHMTHRGYLGDHHYFSNEECWYLGPENAYHGDDLPFGGLPAHGGYTFEISGKPATIRGQVSPAEVHLKSRGNPMATITTMSVNALLDSVAPVCDSPPGIVIDDASPHYVTEVSA